MKAHDEQSTFTDLISAFRPAMTFENILCGWIGVFYQIHEKMISSLSDNVKSLQNFLRKLSSVTLECQHLATTAKELLITRLTVINLKRYLHNGRKGTAAFSL